MYASIPLEADTACTFVRPSISFHIIPANTTAPPTTSIISLPHPLVMTASPVCNPGLEADVVLPTPAVPVGVSAAGLLPPTTVIAVTTDLLPLGRVDVCTTTLVWAAALWVSTDVVLPVGETVEAPPPTVDMTTSPTPLVVVNIAPVVRETEMLDGVVVGDAADDGAAAWEEVTGEEVELGTGAPLDEVLVDVVVTGELPGELTLVSVAEPAGVEDSDI